MDSAFKGSRECFKATETWSRIISNRKFSPDRNKPNEDWSSFTPDVRITHFRICGTTKTEPDRFLNEHYIQEDENPEIKEKMSRDKSYIWTIKKDWYGQDFKYLRENKIFQGGIKNEESTCWSQKTKSEY